MNGNKAYDNSGAYKIMARFYDTMMNADKYEGWKVLITDVVNQYHIPIGTCLDVACGTGNISKLLIDLDFKVLGIDISSDMIKIVQAKFPTEQFICTDARDFEIDSEVQRRITFVVSFYDSLNYLLSDEDMLKTFNSVYCNIPSGTIFLFDMNTIDHVKAAQQYKPRVLEGADFYSVYRSGGDGIIWNIDIDIFMKEGSLYRLVKEKHAERGYNTEDIVPLLEKAGFNLLEIKEEYKTYEDGINRLSRLYFIAQKS